MKSSLYSLDDILRSLDLPVTSQKIYTALLHNGQSTARLLSETLSITRPSTYDHLAILVKKGLVVEKKVENTTYFMADDIRHVKQTLEDKIEELNEKKDLFETMLPLLLKEDKTESPRITFYEGKEGLTRLMNDILWSKGKTIHTLWPYDEMLAVLGKENLVRFNKRRIHEKISIEALWVEDTKTTNNYIWDGNDILLERRRAPKDVISKMGYTVYGDKVSFVASKKEVFGFIVQSKDFSDLMRMHFNALWKTSTKED
jgi:sugar-specific transcriptional regulator TrmB